MIGNPPWDDFGYCPHCGCSQEDAEAHGRFYVCPCGQEYVDEEAHPDPRQMRDEARMRDAGL